MRHVALKTLAIALATGAALMAVCSAAQAGPIWVFSNSVGTQPGNVGTITLVQNNPNQVGVTVDLLNSTYGFLNTGGPHTPFAFNLGFSVAPGDLNLAISSPAGGTYSKGTFSLNINGGDNTPYGSYGIAIDDSAGNGSGNAYYGDLVFTLTRTNGLLSTDDFVANADGYFFSADLTNGENTGGQAWTEGVDPPGTEVPEPLTLSLFAAGLAGMAGMRRRKSLTGATVA